MSDAIVLSAGVANIVSFAMYQAAIPVITELRLRNVGDEFIENLTVELISEPPVIASQRWTFDQIRPHTEVVPADTLVRLDGGMLYKLSERMRATVTIRVLSGETELSTYSKEIIALAHNEWGGSRSTPELLAAFVMPQDPAVSSINSDASEILLEHGRKGSLEGYQSGSRERVWEITSAIWAAVSTRRLAYSEPPASFESSGQKIRLPSEVLGQRLATCLDTAVLFAAALEGVGLRPLICLTKGHAFTGVWLEPRALLGVSTDDASDLRKYIALNEMLVFETTVVTSNPPTSFKDACRLGDLGIRQELDDDFVLALDIRQARAHQVTPLPNDIEQPPNVEPKEAFSPTLEAPPELGSFSLVTVEQVPDTPQERLDVWKRKLLDLTKRNRLLNLKQSKTAIRLVCADAGKLEDALVDGSKIAIVPLESLDSRGGGRDAETLLMLSKLDFEMELARRLLEDNKVAARLDMADLKSGIIELYRKAKSDLDEGGTNTLFLAIGMLKWRESETSTNWYKAPLLLVPVRLERTTAANSPKLMRHADDTVFNLTLLEKLRQDFDLHLPQLEGELPADEHGVDVESVLNIVRTSIRDVSGWEVLNEMVLSTFSFAKYLMWKDLSDNADALRESPFVKHMIDSPHDLYTRTPKFIPLSEQDDRINPMELLTPLSCDSSQVAAIHASGFEGDFVLEGPPGTGKSQTIANLIAHNLGLGRKVLFVAEKITALNVVYDRLEKVGLADFCLVLHSSKANKREVVHQLDQAWSRLGEASAASWDTEAIKLKQIRSDLNAFVRVLHTTGPTGLSPRDAIARASTSRFAPTVKLDWPKDLVADRAESREDKVQLKELARDLGLAYAEVSSEDMEKFSWLCHTEWSYQWQEKFTHTAKILVGALDDAVASVEDFIRKSNLPILAETLTDLQHVADFASTVPSAASVDLHAMLSYDGQEIAEKLRSATQALGSYRVQASALSVRYDDAAISTQTVAQVKQLWAAADSTFWPLSILARRKAVKVAMHVLGASARMDLSSDLRGLEVLASLRSEMARNTDDLPASALWRGLGTEVSQVESMIQLGEEIRAAITRIAKDLGEIPELRQRVRSLFVDGRDLLQVAMPVAVSGERLVAVIQRLTSVISEFVMLAGVSLPVDMQFASLRQFAVSVTVRANRLNPWCRWQRVRKEAIQRSLGSMVTALEAGLVQPKETTVAFEVSYARWIAPLLIDSRLELRHFSALSHSQLVDDFRKLDENLAELAAKSIRARLNATTPRKSDQDVLPGLAVLRRQAQLKARHMPVRKLISEMGEALMQLTPCLLMSPHSVAQFLVAGDMKFDLVVFDEASQIAVWDAIGAIARGKNVIIVGDPKQMPPTNFFNRAADSDDDDDIDSEQPSNNVRDLESILDEGLATGMHHHRLTGHYRSQHESLIAFSNYNYYNGELVTYPACLTQTSMVSLRRCNGAYQKGKGRTNPVEAKALVDEIIARLTDPSRRRQTIGVVTMNTEQQRLIRNLLDDARRQIPEIEQAFKDDANNEIEMVYNLETVQGHERDVIMLSIGYGPTVPGDRTMSMNFGPLNRAGGERRLNVAITRAIREVVVFTSFDPDMIDPTRTSAKAVHDLKYYLEFAKRGPVALATRATASGAKDDFESVFEEQVATLLRAKGWSIRTQIGVSKFRIDLGVVHPDYHGRFLAGVECDGATFHSSPTARDRDRVRHAILTSLGWRLVRLWSTDFFLDPDAAINRIHEKLTELLAKDREVAINMEAEDVAAAEGRQVSDEDDTDFSDDDLESFAQINSPVEIEQDSGTGSDTSIQFASQSLHAPQSITQSPQLSGSPSHERSDTGQFEQFAESFYDDAYLKQLRSLCLHEVDHLGPIESSHLAMRIARAHGFQRTGSEIKKRVSKALNGKRKSTRAPDGSSTLWPEHVEPVSHIPYRGSYIGGEQRPWNMVPYVERLGLAVDIVKTTPPEEREAEMARRLGFSRLRSKTRDELVALLKSAVEIVQAT